MHDIWTWLLNLKDAQLHGGYLWPNSPWPLWLAILATIAVIAVVALIYARDGGPPIGKVIGAALRCLLLVLLLVLIWQPVIRVEHTTRVPGVVALLIDVSRSMTTADPYASDDPIVRDLAAIDAAKAAASQPEQSAKAANPQDPARLAQALKRLAGKTRIQAVRELLTDNHRAALHELLANNELVFYTFDSSQHELARLPQDTSGDSDSPGSAAAADIDRQLKARVEALDDSTAVGAATNVSQAVAGVINDLRGQRLAAVIVVSDGRATEPEKGGKESAIDLASKLAVPIHTVTVGSIHPPRDVAVSQITAEDAVFANDWVAVKALVKQTGVNKPERVKVHLFARARKHADLSEEDWQKLAPEDQYELPKELDARDMTIGEQAGETDPAVTAHIKREKEIELRFKPDKEGKFLLAARVELLESPTSQPDTARLVTRPIRVVDDQIRVLIVEGLPRWEYRFLVHSLIREKTVRPSVWLMTADEEFAQEGKIIDPATGLSTAITRLPVTPEEWDKYDVVLLGDVSPLDLPDAQQRQIEEFVRDKGGGFGMIGGDHFAPQRYLNSPIARLLPVEIDPNAGPDNVTRITGFKMRLTPDGRRSQILRFQEQPELNEAAINSFPEFYWFKPVAALKPGAEQVLAEHPTAKMADGAPAPLFVSGRYGAGKTFFSAVDETWRWRYHTGTAYFETYWLQLVRFLSANKLLGADRRFELSTDQTVYDRGQRVRVLLQVLDRKLTVLPDTLKVRIKADKQDVATIDLRRNGTSYQGEFEPTGDGNWVFTLDEYTTKIAFGAPPGDRNQQMPEVQVVVADNSPEDLDRSIDNEVFPRLATLTLGKSVTLGRLSGLAGVSLDVPGDTGLAKGDLIGRSDLAQVNAELVRRGRQPGQGQAVIRDMSKIDSFDVDHPLWNTNLALTLFAVLITAEWILRKKYNLQ